MKRISTLVSIAVFTVLIIAVIIILYNNYAGTISGETDENIKVALILNSGADDQSWNQTHAEALKRLSDELDLTVIEKENVTADETFPELIRSLAEQEGCRIIIATSFEYGEYITEAAQTYPDVYFLHAAGTGSARNLSTYFGRMYQIRYLSGIVAGMETKTNEIGYVAAFPISEVNRGINAFTLGVRSVNPEAKVRVAFCGSWTGDEEAKNSCELIAKEYDTDILAMHTNSLYPLKFADERGISSIGYNYDNSELYPESVLTSCVWSWEKYYREQILSIRQGKFNGRNDWLDTDTGIAELSGFGGEVKPETIEAVEKAKERFAEHGFDVFYGPVTDNEGKIRIEEGESMSDEKMLTGFDWYTEGVDVIGEG